MHQPLWICGTGSYGSDAFPSANQHYQRDE